MNQPSRRERHKALRRADIERAALALFARKGIEATTIEAIAARADVAKGTFFNHFDNKHEVVASRVRRLAWDFLAFAESEHGNPADPLVRFIRFFTAAEKLFRSEGPAMLSLYREVLVRPDLVAIDAEAEVRILAWTKSVIRAGQEAGVIRADLDAGLAAGLIIDLWSATLRNWIHAPDSFSLAKTLEDKLRLVFRGFAQKP